MKTLLLLLFCGQFTVTVQPPVKEFTVSVQPGATRVEQIVGPVVVQMPKKRYLAFFTASYCGPCQGWKSYQKKQLEKMGYTIFEIEMTLGKNKDKFGSRVTSVPAFVACDWETGKWETEPTVGAISVDEARALLGPPTAAVPTGVVVHSSTQPQATEYRISQGRYYSYGGSTYDLETYSGCSMRNCGMCIEILSAKKRYMDSKVLINQVGPQASSPDDVVTEALALMDLNQDSVFCDLGCGNGSVLIAAAKKAGCRCIGVEIDVAKVEEARRMIADHGLSHKIEVIQGDVRDFNPARHLVTHIYAYLYEDLLKDISGMLTSVDVAVCPGHECPGIGMELVGQCWVRRREDG